MTEESDVVRRVLHGEVDTFRYFIDTYQDMAFTLAVSLLKDESIAEDVVQTAFIQAFRNLNRFKMKSKFSTWFYTIVVNEARIQLRKNKSNVVSLDAYEFHETEQVVENTALLNLHKSDQQRIIHHALSKLSSMETLLIRLFYQDENSIEEIQKITGFSVSKIKTGLHRARRSFNRALSKECRGKEILLSSTGD